MTTKTILGLDLGTNSIGWALIEKDTEKEEGKILGMGSRIIPMSQETIGLFAEGGKISQTADRTNFRSTRRLRERFLLRRERLHRVLNLIGFLPKHFANQIDFEKKLGKFIDGTEPKLAYDQKDFIFKKSFEEMLKEFQNINPSLLIDEKGNNKLVPYDWTLYYLRKKAITQKIEKEELAWIILNFNQKRGYYQLRGEEEEEENPSKLVEYGSYKIIEVTADEAQKGKTDLWYTLKLENGWLYRRQSKTPMFDWLNKTKDFIITTDLNEDGSIKTDKEGKEKRSFRAPKEEDWTLVKKKTELEIEQSSKTVGSYIYETLLKEPKHKIKGKLVRTIERKFYKDELKKILKSQLQYHPELQDATLYDDCIRELYKNNENHSLLLQSKDLTHLLIDDIIFYQRPLKSKKSQVSNCVFESRNFLDANGLENKQPLKGIPKSHPLFQEFRLWQWIGNLRIYQRENDAPINFINSATDFESLFEFLNDRKEITQDALLKYLLNKNGLKGKELNTEVQKYRWNYVDDKEKSYPCNETRFQIVSRISKVEGYNISTYTTEMELQLWHIIYSVTDKIEYEKALKTFAVKNEIDINSFIDNFKKHPPYRSEFGSYSLKAISKLIPLMRIGKYWHWDNISVETKNRINKIITGEYDETIRERVRDKSIHLETEDNFQGLPLWLSSYIVYDRHSEGTNFEKWESIDDINNFLNNFKQHSLKNPIVEQVVTETMRVVRDIWQNTKYGKGTKSYFDEIHIELGRELKNNSEQRSKMTSQIIENENTNLRIKALLAELSKAGDIENVRPHSPSQAEILRIYEDGVLNSDIEIPDDIAKISMTAQPSSTELMKYKLWLEQKYRSPYTGKIIPLNKLFSSEYEIEHIIPRSRHFDDSFSNKVICEAAVNKLKDNQIGREFIKNHHGETVELGNGKVAKILDLEEYESIVKNNYGKPQSKGKRNKLLMDEIPEKMIERQLNDTRYISKYIMSILSNLVRSEVKDDGINSKNIIQGNGKITSILKQDWGLNDVWNDLILPRFERMNLLTNSQSFTSYNKNHQKFLPTIPIEFSKGFQKKRIDHRHHAIDALIIACASRNHINYLNNQNALDKSKNKVEKQKSREDLKRTLCIKTNLDNAGNYKWEFKKPWPGFTVDTRKSLEAIIVSFKQNLRVINKTSNKYESYKDENGLLRIGIDGKAKKSKISQTKGDSWAIRKPMHQETVASEVKLKKVKKVTLSNAIEDIENVKSKSLKNKIKELYSLGYDKKKILNFFINLGYNWNGIHVSNVEIFYWEIDGTGKGTNAASRVKLDSSFNKSKIETITDEGIQKILLGHLANYEKTTTINKNEVSPELLAFSPEGIEEMNKNIVNLNNGKYHQPIFKVRTYEPIGTKFSVGYNGNKKDKLVIAAKGTNLFFAVYWNADKMKRVYETIPLNVVIEHQKWRATLSKEEKAKTPIVPINSANGEFLFTLSPNDLVYLPADDTNNNYNKKIEPNNVYKVVSFTGSECFFIPNYVSALIKGYDAKSKIGEFGSLNKQEISFDHTAPKRIKEYCIKIDIDRLGNIN